MKFILTILFSIFLLGCKHSSREQQDQFYSRHLQRQVRLTVINTPMPSDKSDVNLLLLNDGQDIGKFRVKEIVDSLYESKSNRAISRSMRSCW
jgi:enterochelin esterase-like enzyme